MSLTERLPELRTGITLTAIYEPPEVLKKYSSYKKLLRVMAYCLGFIKNCKRQRKNGPLTVTELEAAQVCVIRMTQREEFASELNKLKANQVIDHKSKLVSLQPILDGNNLIRVGGRLRNASIPMEQKHPIILPSKHHLTKIIMRVEHLRLGHCGPEQLLSEIRQNYWPLSGRREARKVTRMCSMF